MRAVERDGRALVEKRLRDPLRHDAEALALQDRVGDQFEGVVLEAEKDGRTGTVMLRDPAVEAPVRAAEGIRLPVGDHVTATLVEAEPATRRVRFSC